MHFEDKQAIIINANNYSKWLLYTNIANIVGMLLIDLFLLSMSCCGCFSVVLSFIIYIGTVCINAAMLSMYSILYRDMKSINPSLIQWFIDHNCGD